MTQQDDITQRLNEIHADAGYLFGRVAADGACAGAMAESVRARIDAIKALLSKLRAPVADERVALADLLDYVDSNTCIHESTHRGGAIWTICDGCGAKWADDEGGFVPHQDAPAVAAARAALASAPVAGEARPSDAEVLKVYAETVAEYADGRGFEAGTVAFARSLLRRYAAPQASAEDVRNAALEEAAALCESWMMAKTATHLQDMANQTMRRMADYIRALKQPQADKDGGGDA